MSLGTTNGEDETTQTTGHKYHKKAQRRMKVGTINSIGRMIRTVGSQWEQVTRSDEARKTVRSYVEPTCARARTNDD